ncbi:MAG: hypothetical protein WAX29_10870 [Propionibacterium sp.]
MPSFRVRFAVTALRAGHRPEEVLPAARRAVPGTAHCDDVRLDVLQMRPVITVRFTIAGSHDDDEDARAWACGRLIRESMGELAALSAPVVLRRTGQTWTPLAADLWRTGSGPTGGGAGGH